MPTDERANARAAALVILEKMPNFHRLTPERRAALVERNATALLRARKRANGAMTGNGATVAPGGC
ncbi:MAG TPA: hypothetical protein VIU62_06885 [Chloroflexota bacterium]